MRGLLQKAAEIRNISDNRDRNQETDSVKEEIYSEIDRIISKLHAETVSFSTDFSVIKKDSVIPLIVIIGSLIVLLGGGLFFLSFYNSREKTMLTTRSRVLSAESKILAAVKAESEEQLEIRDQRIQSIQNQLHTAIQDRDKLREDSERTLQAREEELRKAMEDALESERAKLVEQGLSGEDIQKRIMETSSRLEAQNQAKLDEFRTQYEKELEEKELAMSRQIDEYQESLEQSLGEQNRLQDLIKQREEEMLREFRGQSAALEDQRESVLTRLKQIQDVNSKEQIVFAQLLASYGSIEKRIENSEYEAAMAEIGNLENFLKQDSVSRLPGVKARIPVENFIINTLRESISMEKTIEEIFPQEKAGLYGDIRKLESRLTNQSAELQAQEELILQADREQKERNVLILKVADLQNEYSSYINRVPESEQPDQEQILDLLAAKVLFKQIVLTESVKSQYPDLLDQLELYLSIFGDNQKEDGRSAAINEINYLLESLIDESGSSATYRPWTEQSSSRNDFEIFLDNLNKLLD
jgi:hypothetical protein